MRITDRTYAEKSAEQMLAEGLFRLAERRCSEALSDDPENARLYLIRLMAVLGVRSPDDLPNLPDPFDHLPDYQLAMKYGWRQFGLELVRANDAIRARNARHQTRLRQDRERVRELMEDADRRLLDRIRRREARKRRWKIALAVLGGLAFAGLLVLAVLRH